MTAQPSPSLPGVRRSPAGTLFTCSLYLCDVVPCVLAGRGSPGFLRNTPTQFSSGAPGMLPRCTYCAVGSDWSSGGEWTPPVSPSGSDRWSPLAMRSDGAGKAGSVADQDSWCFVSGSPVCRLIPMETGRTTPPVPARSSLPSAAGECTIHSRPFC